MLTQYAFKRQMNPVDLSSSYDLIEIHSKGLLG